MKEFLREAGKVAAVSQFERGKQPPAALGWAPDYGGLPWSRSEPTAYRSPSDSE